MTGPRHQFTDRHRAGLRAASRRTLRAGESDAMNGSRAARFRRAREVRRAEAGTPEQGLMAASAPVRTHTRSRPNDGARKVVKVRRYRRMKALPPFFDWKDTAHGWVRVTYSGRSGAAVDVRSVSAQAARTGLARNSANMGMTIAQYRRHVAAERRRGR
jgi:hypothetical protein